MARTQEYFAPLAVFTTNDDYLLPSEDSLEFKAKRMRSEKDIYVPVNFISQEVCSMIAAWEACTLSKANDLNTNSSIHKSGSSKTADPSLQKPTTTALSPPTRYQRAAAKTSAPAK